MTRTLARISLAGVLLAATFAWGFLTQKERIPPYRQIRLVAVALGLAEPEQEKLERSSTDLAVLRALPYVDGTYDDEASAKGVVLHHAAESWPGYNLYNSEGSNQAYLLDMDGAVVHRWRHSIGGWHYSELLPNGDLLALAKDEALLRLDASSKLLWSYPARVHHGAHVSESDDIRVLTRREVLLDSTHPRVPTLVDFVTRLTAGGEFVEEFSLHDLIDGSAFSFLMPSVSHVPFESLTKRDFLDVLHANSVSVFDGSLEALGPLYEKGNYLVSFKHISSIAIISGEEDRVLWLWGPMNVVFQHHPTLLENGNILLFNNGNEESSVIEIDPLTEKIEWQYGPREGFFSAARGSAQRLPNGNTLITESDKGYVFEVTTEGKTVWKFANPDISAEGLRRAIYRMQRFDPAELPFLTAAPAGG